MEYAKINNKEKLYNQEEKNSSSKREGSLSQAVSEVNSF
jgi:hypothetical protein